MERHKPIIINNNYIQIRLTEPSSSGSTTRLIILYYKKYKTRSGLDRRVLPRANSDRKLLRKLNDSTVRRLTDTPIIDTILEWGSEKCVGRFTCMQFSSSYLFPRLAMPSYRINNRPRYAFKVMVIDFMFQVMRWEMRSLAMEILKLPLSRSCK